MHAISASTPELAVAQPRLKSVEAAAIVSAVVVAEPPENAIRVILSAEMAAVADAETS
jgi:hypothetical protein